MFLALSLTGDSRHRLPHHVSFCLAEGEVTGKTLVRQMNLAGIGISAGSACHSGKLSPSPILQAMGFSDRPATSGIRLTLGRHTGRSPDIDWTALVLQQVLSRTLGSLIASDAYREYPRPHPCLKDCPELLA